MYAITEYNGTATLAWTPNGKTEPRIVIDGLPSKAKAIDVSQAMAKAYAAGIRHEPICEKCSTEKLGQFHKPEDCPLRNYNFQDAPPIAAQSEKEKSGK